MTAKRYTDACNMSHSFPALPSSRLLTHQHLLPKRSTRARKATRVTVLRQLLAHAIIFNTALQVLIPRLFGAAHLLHIAIACALLAARFVAKCLHGAAETAGLHDAFWRSGGYRDGGRGLGASLDSRGFSGRRCSGDGLRRSDWLTAGRCRGYGRGSGATSWGSVPVRLGIAEALAGCNAFPAIGLDEPVVVRSQVGNGLLDNVVLDREVIGNALALGVGEGSLDDVLGILDLRWERVQVVLGIEIKVDAVVAKGFHVCLAA